MKSLRKIERDAGFKRGTLDSAIIVAICGIASFIIYIIAIIFG